MYFIDLLEMEIGSLWDEGEVENYFLKAIVRMSFDMLQNQVNTKIEEIKDLIFKLIQICIH